MRKEDYASGFGPVLDRDMWSASGTETDSREGNR